MKEVGNRIEGELGRVMERLRQLGGAIVFEEFPGSLADQTPLPDLVDKVQVEEEREVRSVTRSLLVKRAHRLAEALERIRTGQYGICEECGEAVSPARLEIMPEATTCVRCQERLERGVPRPARTDMAVQGAMRKRNRRRLQRAGGVVP